jgi:hypothetical protein
VFCFIFVVFFAFGLLPRSFRNSWDEEHVRNFTLLVLLCPTTLSVRPTSRHLTGCIIHRQVPANSQWGIDGGSVYHYHTSEDFPFTVGCYGHQRSPFLDTYCT